MPEYDSLSSGDQGRKYRRTGNAFFFTAAKHMAAIKPIRQTPIIALLPSI